MTFLPWRRKRTEAQQLIATAQIEADAIRTQAHKAAAEIVAAAKANPTPTPRPPQTLFEQIWTQTAGPVDNANDFFASIPARHPDEMFSP